MIRIVKKQTWCDWPDPKYKYEAQDFVRMCKRCDAWRAFFSSPIIRALKRIEGHVIWFNKYEVFERLICDFGCSKAKLTKVVRRYLKQEWKEKIVFQRKDIYDPRGWVYLPLTAFVDVDGFRPREQLEDCGWKDNVLGREEIPIVQLSVPLPWIVEDSCFKLQHRIKEGKRLATLFFSHPGLDRKFENARWVAEGNFSIHAKRKDMRDELLSIVREKSRNYLVTISQAPAAKENAR